MIHELIEVLEHVLVNLVTVSTIIFEFFGWFIVARAIVIGFYRYLKGQKGTSIFIAQNMSISLQFLMSAEILRTITENSWEKLGLIGALVVIRAALSVILHWEMTNEKKEEREEEELEEKRKAS